MGALWAWGITGFEVVAAGLLLVGRAVRLVSLLLAVEISFGICLLHWHHGWFVVGHGGNGSTDGSGSPTVVAGDPADLVDCGEASVATGG